MRDTLADASLARYAGQFVWLALDFDRTENQKFLAQYAVLNTPTFFIIDPTDERVVATQVTAMTLVELKAFLERGEQATVAKSGAPADIAYARGDALLAHNSLPEAVATFREALRLGGKTWSQRGEAIGSLTWA